MVTIIKHLIWACDTDKSITMAKNVLNKKKTQAHWYN